MAKATNARFIFATHKDLPALVESGAFRRDLYYRLQTHNIHIPPLRERQDDLPLLLESFILSAAEEFNKELPTFDTELVSVLSQYTFPGNIRELKSMVFDAVGRNQTEVITPHLFPVAVEKEGKELFNRPSTDTQALGGNNQFWLSQLAPLPNIKDLTEDLISEALRRSKSNQRQAARMLGITPQALNQRLKRK